MSENAFFQEKIPEENTRIMPILEVIDKVTAICRAIGVRRLDLFGSFATGTATATSDIAWKAMKDILIKELEILDFALGSPRETLSQTCSVICILMRK